MAVFFVNTCKFNSCGITFPTLQELIRHIEETHLNFDPKVMEENIKHPTCLPISYVLRVFSADYSSHKKETTSFAFNHLKTKSGRSHSPALSITSTTPTGSEMDDENYASESEDSWSNVSNEGDSSLFKMMSSSAAISSDDQDKPYPCVVNGCKKRYRNANGLKYHVKNAHPSANFPPKRESNEITKYFRCNCGKVYKTQYGLKNHISTHHSNQPAAVAAKYLPTGAGSQPVRMDVIPVKQSQSTYTTSSSSSPSSTTSSAMATNILGPPATQAAEGVCEETNLPQQQGSNGVKEVDLGKINVKIQEPTAGIEITHCEEIQGTSSISVAPTLQQHLLKPLIARTPAN